MNNNGLEENNNQNFKIKTPQGEVDITWPTNPQPGFCPHCHKCIPFHSIVFKKMNGDSEESFSGKDMLNQSGKMMEQDTAVKNNIGECPYCHKTIPIREIILKKAEK